MKKIICFFSLLILLLCVSCDGGNEPVIESNNDSNISELSNNNPNGNTSELEQINSSENNDETSNSESKDDNKEDPSEYDNPYEDDDTWHRI